MGHFRRTAEGWLRGTPSAETLAWARRVEAEGDRNKPNDMGNFSNRRWQGFVAERGLHVWLTDRGVAHCWNGSCDPEPDFELGGLGVGVKCCGSMVAWHDRLVVNIYDRHRSHPWDEVFFVGYEHGERPTIVLLGGLPSAVYFDRATFVRAGEPLNPRVTAKNDVWNLATRLLEPPDAWLARTTKSPVPSGSRALVA